MWEPSEGRVQDQGRGQGWLHDRAVEREEPGQEGGGDERPASGPGLRLLGVGAELTFFVTVFVLLISKRLEIIPMIWENHIF